MRDRMTVLVVASAYFEDAPGKWQTARGAHKLIWQSAARAGYAGEACISVAEAAIEDYENTDSALSVSERLDVAIVSLYRRVKECEGEDIEHGC